MQEHMRGTGVIFLEFMDSRSRPRRVEWVRSGPSSRGGRSSTCAAGTGGEEWQDKSKKATHLVNELGAVVDLASDGEVEAVLGAVVGQVGDGEGLDLGHFVKGL